MAARTSVGETDMTIGRLGAAAAAVAAIGFGATAAMAKDPLTSAAADVAKYAFLEGSRWIVPPATLPAILYEPEDGTVRDIVDQTVWDITGYRDGYFWGRTVARLSDAATGEPLGGFSCLDMVGSVTPGGRVHITFVDPERTTVLTAIRGTGLLVRGRGNRWQFEEMQMSSGFTSLVVHWSYMVECRPGDACEAELPGTTSSLAEFLAACDEE